VSSALPNLNMKHYKSAKILSNLQYVKTPCANLTPYSRLSGDGSGFKPHICSHDSLVACDSYQSHKVRNTRIVSLTVTTIWVRFT